MPIATTLPEAAQRAIDRCDRISTCWKAIADLVIPDHSGINFKERDHIATLMDFLNEEYAAARAALTTAMRDAENEQPRAEDRRKGTRLPM